MKKDTMTEMDNPLIAYAKWVAETPADWSALALGRARNAFIDTMAVMVAGLEEPATQKTTRLATRWSKGNIHTVGAHGGLSAPMAALVNGTAAHALDFDDNFDPAKAHASAVLVPALLAAGEENGSSYIDLLDGYIVGLQVMGVVGQGVNPFHRSRGWHATATLGTIGAAAACARLMKLNTEQTANAISFSTSLAGGFMSQFGTMTKPIHAGLAASRGVEAAGFASEGVTAGMDALHGPQGMGTLMVGPDVEDLRVIMADKDEYGQKVTFLTNTISQPLHIEKYGLKPKRFPNCGSIHRGLDGLLELRERHDFNAATVKEVLVRAPAAHLRNLMYENPSTPSEARFSLEYSLAAGLLNGNVGSADYLPDAVKRPDVRALMPIIKKEYVEKLESDFPTEVHVTLTTGEVVMTSVDMPVGSSAKPFSDKQLWQKYDACVEGILTKSAAKETRKKLETVSSEKDYVADLLSGLKRESGGVTPAHTA